MTAEEARELQGIKTENPDFVDIPGNVKEFIDAMIYHAIFHEGLNKVRLKADLTRVNPSDYVAYFIAADMEVVAKYLEQQGFKVNISSEGVRDILSIEW